MDCTLTVSMTLELGNLMAENHGLDVDMESHPGLLMLTE
jgi:hypothetical protein